jgi:hypothetical protein
MSAVMNAPTVQADSTQETCISEDDLREALGEIMRLDPPLDTLDRWVKKGAPARDIEPMEIGNVIQCAQMRPDYQQVRDRICAKYGIDEREFMRQLLYALT